MDDFAPTPKDGETVHWTHWGNWVWTCLCGFEAGCSEDVLSWPACSCVRLHGAICEDCQRDIMQIRNRPYHDGEHFIVARRQVEEWQRLEDAELLADQLDAALAQEVVQRARA